MCIRKRKGSAAVTKIFDDATNNANAPTVSGSGRRCDNVVSMKRSCITTLEPTRHSDIVVNQALISHLMALRHISGVSHDPKYYTWCGINAITCAN